MSVRNLGPTRRQQTLHYSAWSGQAGEETASYALENMLFH